MVRYHADVRRVSGTPTPSDPGSWIADLRVPRHAAHKNVEVAKTRIRESLSQCFGGEFEVVGIRTSFLGGRR